MREMEGAGVREIEGAGESESLDGGVMPWWRYPIGWMARSSLLLCRVDADRPVRIEVLTDLRGG